MNVNEFLKATKRKYEQDDSETPYTGAGSSSSSSSSVSSSKKLRTAYMEDIPDDDREGYDEEDGYDRDYEDDEKEEGDRFFGDGLTEKQRDILEMLDQADEAPAPAMDIPQLKKMVQKMERSMQKNQELREKYASDPLKFADSEADLEESIRALFVLSAYPTFYPDLVAMEIIPKWLDLLAHENTDISLKTVELLNELTDEDVLAEQGEEIREQAEEGVRELVKALNEYAVFDFLMQNMVRLDEENAEERQGVFNTLSVIENVTSVEPSLAEVIVERTKFLNWLLQRLKVKTWDSNKQYCSEILAILLQNSRPNRLRLGEMGGVDVLLECVARFKRKDPKDDDETEFMENLFDALCSCLNEAEIKKIFLEGEGVELMSIMLKEMRLSRFRALRVLNYAMLGEGAQDVCDHFVKSQGLKVLFPLFMKKHIKKLKKEFGKYFVEREQDEHVISIISSLFRNLPVDISNASRARLLSKFLEDNCAKVDQLLSYHLTYLTRLRGIDSKIEGEKQEMDYNAIEDDDERELVDEEFYLNRLEGGLLTLQLTDYILACCAVDDSIGDEVREVLKVDLEDVGRNVAEIMEVLKEYVENLGDESPEANEEKERIRRIVEKFGEVMSL